MKKSIEIAKKQNLNWQSILIEEAQTDIKVELRNYIQGKATYKQAIARIKRIIKQTVDDLESQELKVTTNFTLRNYVIQLLHKAFEKIGIPIALYVMALASVKTGVKFKQVAQTYSITLPKELPDVFELGKPTVFSKEYMRQVEQVYNELAKAEPMYDKSVSLRNVAEMTVRYDRQIAKINQLIDRGVNLVVSSTHANCSKRCEPWQGGHYTLDGTYQVVDNIQFQPIENAMNQYYTTKAGKVYRNGHITGYNCRHYLIEYKKGVRQIPVSAKTIEREREIDHKMRYMERQVREWKDRALMHKGENKALYEQAVTKARLYNKRYIEYARSHKRPYYPSRTDVF